MIKVEFVEMAKLSVVDLMSFARFVQFSEEYLNVPNNFCLILILVGERNMVRNGNCKC